ncbi:HNH endonuclease [Orpheovirus IHUMI-LCC2]|uniref:Uncharacterized protein n=1 Tax=Orpheovirus IHUMI-LCC2 TaxID=2023057 RepID=A0A2I2L357_9VIRU|nr:HNH endonuclease [Orpheovirus IHUMI-LCC2]SNW61964.1 Hypothetical protein ORPV_60 [Orpheovirus IHUMI-LCC2]
MNKRQENCYNNLLRICEEKGGKLISKVYVNNKTPLTFICANGHTFDKLPDYIISGTWCTEYSCKYSDILKRDKLLLNGMLNIRKAILLNSFIGYKESIEVKCCNSHILNISLENILKGMWCECYNYNKDKEKLVKEIINAREGELLVKYNKYREKVDIKCKYGHIFSIVPYGIVCGNWCGQCYTKNNPTKAKLEFNKTCKERGYTVLEEYVRALDKVLIECRNGHRWNVTPGKINWGQGCKVCYYETMTLEDTKCKFYCKVNKKGGKVTGIYKNVNTKISVICGKGHQWNVKPNRILFADTWCPNCKNTRSKGEEIIETYLLNNYVWHYPQYVHRDLTKYRYDFLILHNNKYYLIEFDGMQHFSFSSFFHENEEFFKRRREIDIIKTKHAKLCGIPLIRIDYTQINNIIHHILIALNSSCDLYLSTPEMYKWLTE